jgi:hypothetical protein
MEKAKTVLRLELFQMFPQLEAERWGIRVVDCPTCKAEGRVLADYMTHENAVSAARCLGELVDDPGEGTW